MDRFSALACLAFRVEGNIGGCLILRAPKKPERAGSRALWGFGNESGNAFGHVVRDEHVIWGTLCARVDDDIADAVRDQQPTQAEASGTPDPLARAGALLYDVKVAIRCQGGWKKALIPVADPEGLARARRGECERIVVTGRHELIKGFKQLVEVAWRRVPYQELGQCERRFGKPSLLLFFGTADFG